MYELDLEGQVMDFSLFLAKINCSLNDYAIIKNYINIPPTGDHSVLNTSFQS